MQNPWITFTFVLYLAACSVASTEVLWAKTPPNSKNSNPSVSASKNPVTEQQFMKTLSDRVQKEINSHLPKNIKQDTQTVLVIKLDKSGKLDEVKIDKSSGVNEADEAALCAVRKCAPFGVLPSNFGDGLALKYTFQFAANSDNNLASDGSVVKPDTNEYMNKVREKITHSWRSPDVKAKCQTTISFAVEKSGSIKTIAVKKSSGNKTVDDAALLAIKRSAPFDPLPEAWKHGFAIEYTLSAGPKSDVQHYKFNDVSLPNADFQISRGGAKLHPLEWNKKIENKLQDRQFALEDQLKALKSKLDTVSDSSKKCDLLCETGKIYLELHKFQEAVNSFEQAAGIESGGNVNSVKYALIKLDLAFAYCQKNQLEEACAAYQKSIEILKSASTTNTASNSDTENLKNALTGYAKALYKQNKPKEADAVYAEIRALK